nr:probable serine/threonine-protein kinase PBL3 [Quercus suber]
MGNCLGSSGSRVPKFSIRTERSSAPSSLTIQSFSDKSNASSEILSSPNLKALTFNELKNSTRNFHPDSFLGEGRFGYVFKGWIDEYTCSAAKPGSGMAIAVKKLKSERFQGHKKWLTEVNYIGQLHHPNLIKLIGYCLEGENRLLVYEFMPKGSLENHLFKRGPQGPQSLSWEIRIKVAIGAARGLCFLHEAKPHVIYLDFKASNILLDAEHVFFFADPHAFERHFNLVNKEDLERVLRAEIFVNEADNQVRATHKILGYKPIQKSFPAPKDFRRGESTYVADALEMSLLLPADMAQLGDLRRQEVILSLKRLEEEANNQSKAMDQECDKRLEAIWTLKNSESDLKKAREDLKEVTKAKDNRGQKHRGVR